MTREMSILAFQIGSVSAVKRQEPLLFERGVMCDVSQASSSGIRSPPASGNEAERSAFSQRAAK